MFSDNALCQVLSDLQYHIPTVDLRIILEKRPDLVQRRSNFGYPLHEACERGLSLSIIHTLVQKFPKAVTANMRHDRPYTPLFEACSRDAPDMDIIAYLVKADPFCLRGTSDRPPLLHFCVSYTNQNRDNNRALVDWIWKQYPEAVDLPDFKGLCAIHHAVDSLDVQRFRQLILKTTPKCLIDRRGNHVLHLAVNQYYTLPQVLTCIVWECPAAAACANHRGELPVHVAIQRQDRNLLLQHYPFAMLYTTYSDETVLGNVRRELDSYFEVQYPRSDDDVEDWELPCVTFGCKYLSYRQEFEEMVNIIIHKVIPPLRKILSQSSQTGTGTCLPSEVLDNILLFAVPHYEEAVSHTPYDLDESGQQRLRAPAVLDARKFKIPRLE